jgi:hypothetical protein
VAEWRRVVVSETAYEEAHAHFPSGGTGDEKEPSFELCEVRPLQAARDLFGAAFESLPEAEPGTGIRYWITVDAFFPALLFFGVLLATGEVEIISVTVDDDYWNTVGDDPV